MRSWKVEWQWRKHDKWDVNGDDKPKRIGFKRWKMSRPVQAGRGNALYSLDQAADVRFGHLTFWVERVVMRFSQKIWKGYEAADDLLSLHSVRQPSPAPSEELYYYDTSRPTASQRFYERLRKAGNANIYRNPLREMPTVPSSDSVEIILDNSRGTPISGDHDDDTFATIDGPLDSGDLDKQDAYDEAICELDLTQVDGEEEPDLPPLPPASPPPDRKEYPSTYLRLMDMMHEHRQTRRRTSEEILID
ncbi:hypothetical protein E4U49_000420 [Claviceps purpurea]|nr:hypothetical protein E4U49_000420 [Claviceps purpurea]